MHENVRSFGRVTLPTQAITGDCREFRVPQPAQHVASRLDAGVQRFLCVPRMLVHQRHALVFLRQSCADEKNIASAKFNSALGGDSVDRLKADVVLVERAERYVVQLGPGSVVNQYTTTCCFV